MTRGLLVDGQSLAVKNKMRQARVFLDGEHIAYDVTIGDVVVFRRSEEPLIVLGLKKSGSSRHDKPLHPATRRVAKE